MDTELWWRMSARHQFRYVAAPLALQQRQRESKTVKHMPGIYEEKARLFGPILEKAEPHLRARHRVARRRGMGRRWLGFAQSASRSNRTACLDFLARARRENPLLLLSPRWWSTRLLSRTTPAEQ